MSISLKIINHSRSNVTTNGTTIPPGGTHEIPTPPIQLPDGLMVDVPGKGEIYLLEGGANIHDHVKTSWGIRIISGGRVQYWGYEGHPLMVLILNEDGTYTITASDRSFTKLTQIQILPTPSCPVRILSNYFPNVFLSMDGSGLTEKNPQGGVVNCQFGEDDSELMSLIANPDGTHSFKSMQFPNVYLRIDGTGFVQPNPYGGGVVNCHFGERPGPYEKFNIHKHPEGYTVESNKFPNVFLRISGSDVTENTGLSGVVNCQYTRGVYEFFHLGHSLREAVDSLGKLAPGEKAQLEKYEDEIVRQIIEGGGTAPDSINYSNRVVHIQSILPDLPPCEEAIGVFVVDIVFVVLGMWGIRVSNQERIARAVVRQLGGPTLRGFARAVRDFDNATTSYQRSKAAFTILSGVKKAGGFSAVFHALKDEMTAWEWMKTSVIASAQLAAWFATDGIAFIAEFALLITTAEQMVEDGIKANKTCKGSSKRISPNPQSPFSQGFDSITEFKGKLYVTQAGKWIRYSDPLGRVLDTGYPLPIGPYFWGNLPSEFFEGFDAMFVFPNSGDLMVSKGSMYAYYKGYTLGKVRPIAKHWPGLPKSFQDGFDTIAALLDKKVYITKGDQYVRGNMDKGGNFHFEYQLPIEGQWGLEKVAGTEAFKLGFDAMSVIGGKTYVFKGDQYLRYSDSNATTIDPGYPMPIAGNF